MRDRHPSSTARQGIEQQVVFHLKSGLTANEPIANHQQRCENASVPVAKPPLPIEAPAPIDAQEAEFIKATARRYYGSDAVVRSYSPDPSKLYLHVETSLEMGLEKYECMGVLFTRIEREQITLVVTKRGTKVRGGAKIAYRQGEIL